MTFWSWPVPHTKSVIFLLSSRGNSSLTQHVLEPLAHAMQVAHDRLEKRRLGRFARENHAGSDDDRMVEIQFFDRVLDAHFHLAVRNIFAHQASRPARRNEHKGFRARFLGGFGDGNAQVMVDRPLVLDAACGGTGCADGVEDDGRRRRERFEVLGPLGGIGFFDGGQLGGRTGWFAARDGGHGGEVADLRSFEEGREDLAADGAGAPEDCGRCHFRQCDSIYLAVLSSTFIRHLDSAIELQPKRLDY